MILARWLGVCWLSIAAGCVPDRTAPPTPASASAAASPSASAPQRRCEPAPVYAPDPAERERDEILSLAAGAVALRGWDAGEERASGIAAILADASGQVLCWARQETQPTHDKTQHAEVRLIQNYLRNSRRFDASGLSLYVTLEPCVMCTGMIAMTRVHKAIYGARAPGSGGVFDRMALDSTAIGGECPHRYSVLNGLAPGPISVELEGVPASPRGRVDSERRRAIFERAEARLRSYKPQDAANQSVLRNTLDFLEQVPRGYVPVPYREACPPRGVSIAQPDAAAGRRGPPGARWRKPPAQELPGTGP